MTNKSEEKISLNARVRLLLIQTVNALPRTQFDELVFALNPPKGNVLGDSAPQEERSVSLLEWAESSIGPGLSILEEVLSRIVGTHSKPEITTFVISGKVDEVTAAELQAFVKLLRSKIGDNSIEITFLKED